MGREDGGHAEDHHRSVPWQSILCDEVSLGTATLRLQVLHVSLNAPFHWVLTSTGALVHDASKLSRQPSGHAETQYRGLRCGCGFAAPLRPGAPLIPTQCCLRGAHRL